MVYIPPDRRTVDGLPRPGRRRASEAAPGTGFLPTPTGNLQLQQPQSPTTGEQGAAPRRLRPGLQVATVPVRALVTVELIVLATALAVTVRAGWTQALMGVVVFLTLLEVPVHGLALGGWLTSAVGYRLRGHVVEAFPSGARQSSTSGDASDSGTGAHPVVSAFFPALSIRDGLDHDGRPIGVLRWREGLNVTCRVSSDVAELLSERKPRALPLESLCTSVFSSGIPVASLQVFTQHRSADPLRTDSAVLGKLADALSQSTALARVRDVYVSVRVNPLRAADAIAMRGGGDEGVDRVLAALTSRIGSELHQAGLRCEVLDGEAAGQAVAGAFAEPAGTEDDAIRWLESWRRIGSANVVHRSLVLTGWGGSDLEPVLRIPCLAMTVLTQLRPDGADQVSARTTVRVSAGSLRELTEVTDRVRATVRATGGSVREVRGGQLAAMRASSPIGGW